MLAVPGSPLDPRARGCNDLIRQGAALCESAEDVLRAIETLPGFRAPPPDLFEHLDREDASDALRETVFGLLSPTPVAIDDTPESGAVVPPEFMRVQWIRLPSSLPTPQFVEQIKRLVSTPAKPNAMNRPAGAPTRTRRPRFNRSSRDSPV